MRINDKILESMADALNDVTKSPRAPYTKNEGVYKANIGNYNVSHSYNAVSLHRISNDGGGVESIYGPCSNRELYCFMTGHIRGFTDGKNSRIRRRKKLTVEKA